MRNATGAFGIALALIALGALRASAAPPDAWITTKAKMTLFTTDGVDATDVDVDTVNGHVTLHGKVRSDAERRAAETAVRGVSGVTGVRNLLQVVGARREEAVQDADDRVQAHVRDVLAADDALRDVRVESVNAGVVLLGGRVATLGDHLRALEHAARVPGVKRVASEVESPDALADSEIYADRPPTQARSSAHSVSDIWITSAVKMRLIADERTPGLDVNVDTSDGRVTLFGTVPSRRAKAAAEDDAQKVSGVRSVTNELQVVAPSQAAAVHDSDAQVKDNVERALRAQDELRDDSIDVEVSDGVARLTGTVDKATDRVRAAVVARTARGVRAVRDDLAIAAR